MFGIGMPELLVILLICLLVFGADKLPEIGKSMAKTIKEFKKEVKTVSEDVKRDTAESNRSSV